MPIINIAINNGTTYTIIIVGHLPFIIFALARIADIIDGNLASIAIVINLDGVICLFLVF